MRKRQVKDRNRCNHLPAKCCDSQSLSRLKKLMMVKGGVGGGNGDECLDIFVGVWASRGWLDRLAGRKQEWLGNKGD